MSRKPPPQGDHSALTDEDRGKEIVAAYKSGMKVLDIEHTFGVPRSTLYYLLNKHGERPQRLSKGYRASDQDVAILYEIIERQNERIKNLEQQLLNLGIDPTAEN